MASSYVDQHSQTALETDCADFAESSNRHYDQGFHSRHDPAGTAYAVNTPISGEVETDGNLPDLSPTRHWFKDGNRLRSILMEKNSNFATFIDLDTVDAIIREHEGGYNRERHIFLLVCLYFWFSTYA